MKALSIKTQIRDAQGYIWKIESEPDTYTGGIIYNVTMWKGRRHIYVVGLPDTQDDKRYTTGEIIDMAINYIYLYGNDFQSEIT